MRNCFLSLAFVTLLTSNLFGQRVGVGSYGRAPDAPGRDPDPAKVSIVQNLGAQVPLDLVFRDENNESITLRQAGNGKPIILVLAYYRCPQMCNLVMNDVFDAMKAIEPDVGDKYSLVVISFDPKDSYVIAQDKKSSYLNYYNRPNCSQGVHFLTGGKTEIDDVCSAVGFLYQYDKINKRYDHGSGIIVLTPQGIVSKYFLGLKYDSKELWAALNDATGEKVGTAIDKSNLVNWLCGSYDPHTGKYSLSMMKILRSLAALTVFVIIGWVFLAWRRGPIDKNKQQPIAPAQ